MDILKSLVVKVYQTIGKIQASAMAFGIHKGYFISAILGIFTIISYSNITITKSIEFSSLCAILATIISTGSTIISSILGYKHASSSFQVISSNEYKNKILRSIELSDKSIENGYEIHNFYSAECKESYVMSDIVNQHLANNVIQFKTNPESFCISDDIKPKIPSILRNTLNKNSIIFNGKLIRLSCDVNKDSSILEIQKTKYFDGLCTNELVFKLVKNVHTLNEIFMGEKLLIDSQNKLISLDISYCSNYIGASTLVFTRNGKIIIGRQGQKSAANANRYAPSGSGSVGKNDMKKASSFNEILTNAMHREFCEENSYKLSEISRDLHTVIIGYCRLLERGGKPDFFGVTYLDRDIETVNKLNTLELGLSADSELLDFSKSSPEVVFGQFCEEKSKTGSLSIQLHILNEIYKTIDIYKLSKSKS